MAPTPDVGGGAEVVAVVGQVGCRLSWNVLLDCRWIDKAVKSYGIHCEIEARIILYITTYHPLWHAKFYIVLVPYCTKF